MKSLNATVFFLALLILSSCGQKPKGEEAEVSEAKEVQEVAVTATEYVMALNSSKITWIGSKPTGKHNGSIPLSSGNLSIEGDKIVGGEMEIDINGITCEDLPAGEKANGDLIGHLKSPDFFSAEEFPSAKFVITSVEEYSPDESMEVKEEFDTEFKPASAAEYMVSAPTHKITGNLTMRGTTLSVAFPAQVSMTDSSITASAKFNIDRTRWGISYGDEATAVDKAKDKFIYNTVNVGFDISAEKQSM